MARYIQEYCLTETKERVHVRLCQFLNNNGYTTQQYRGETVFCKGSAAIGNETMVKFSFPTGMVRVEAWLKTMSIPGIADGELSVEGYYGIALKGELKSVVLELDKLLGGAGNRIGTHPYLAKKASESAQAPLLSFLRQNEHSNTKASEPMAPRQWAPMEQIKQQFQSVQKPVHAEKPATVSKPAAEPAAPVKPAPQSTVASEKPVNQSAGAPVDINRCSQSELMTLPGIGVVQAKKAMEYREQNGGFRSLDEFVDVLQIKPHFAVQIFSRATASPAAQKSAPQTSHTAHSRRTFDF